jgi:hypothetical protein
MPTQVKIIRASEFLIVTPEGRIDFDTSKRLLFSITSASTTLATHEVLLDLRSARSGLSATDVWRLAAEFSRRPASHSGKIAILCRLSGEGQAAFFALCAQNQGLLVRAFTSFEEAVEWLIADGPQHVESLA